MYKKALFFSFLSLLIVSTILILGCQNTQKNMKTVDNVLSQADQLVGETVIVEGLCTHVCAKSGMKLFLQSDDPDEQTIRVESNGNLGKFDQTAVDKKVRVTGKLVEERIDEAYLQDLEKKIAANTVVSHGEGGEGCATEQQTEGVEEGSSEMQRVNDFRARIAKRKAKDGKEYLSFYHIAANSYHIVE